MSNFYAVGSVKVWGIMMNKTLRCPSGGWIADTGKQVLSCSVGITTVGLSTHSLRNKNDKKIRYVIQSHATEDSSLRYKLSPGVREISQKKKKKEK